MKTTILKALACIAAMVVMSTNGQAADIQAKPSAVMAINILGPIGVAGIVAEPTPELLKLQADIIAAVAPFTVETGDSSAFITTPDDPVIDPLLIDYVSTFVPRQTGEHYSPHVSTGVALKEYVDQMLAEPFEPFTFSPAGAAVYQLGQFGTAAKKLKIFDLKP